ncbi:MAG: hypothetical protein GF398_11305 [Chitinivibrionales bacterium]|nr:hypothetical protein [Chitinivibrionales bacterium]
MVFECQCQALDAAMIMIAFMPVYPADLRHKPSGIGIGLPVLTAVTGSIDVRRKVRALPLQAMLPAGSAQVTGP